MSWPRSAISSRPSSRGSLRRRRRRQPQAAGELTKWKSSCSASTSFFVWLIFIKFKWLPWNTVSQVTVVMIPIVALTAMILTLNIYAPSSHDVRVFKYTVPVVSQVRGRVIEVPIEEGNRLVTEGRRAVQGRSDAVSAHGQRLAGAAHRCRRRRRGLREQLASAAGNTAALRVRIDLARKRVEQNRELATSGAGNRFDLEQAESDLQNLAGAASAPRSQTKLRSKRELAAVVDGDIASIARIKADLANAQWDLDQTTAVSPCECYVINLQLRPGGFVAALPVAPVMTLVEAEGQVVALFYQNELHQVAAG